MTQENFESQFLDYLENKLPAADMERLRLELESNAALRASFEEYSKIVAAEKVIAAESHALHPSFSVKVMDMLDSPAQQGFIKRLYMYFSENRKLIYSSVATCATLVVVLSITNRPLPLDVETDMIREHQRVTALAAKSELSDVGGSNIQAPVVAKELKPAAPELRGDLFEAGAEPEVAAPSRDLALKQKKDTSVQPQPVVPAETGSLGRSRAEESMSAGGAPVMRDSLSGISKDLKSNEQRGSEIHKKLLERVQAQNESISDSGQGLALSNPGANMTASISGAPKTRAVVRFGDGTIANWNPPAPMAFNPPSSESYINVSENKRTLVQDEPVSTFSIDVDTASYSNTRRFISSGQLPPADAVRIEEFVNYFDYAYPVQYEKPFTLSYEIAPSPLDKDKFLLKLGVKARDAQPNEKGWNLVLLVDVSGSMSDQNKLPLLKRSLPVLVERMRPQDRIAIVTYAGNAGVALESTNGTEKTRILNAIDNLASGGSTNGAGGINAAYDIAQRSRIEGGVNRVILMTDGDFNVGITSHEDLIRLIEQKRRSGITLTTIGVGTGNLKDGAMEQLADKGNGNYFYLDSFKEARKVLQTDLAGNMEVVAKDVKLQIEFNPQQVAEYRLVGYDNRRLQKQDFNNDAIDAGEIGTGHTVTALYEVVLANTEAAKRLQDDLRYQKATEQKKVEIPEDKRTELAFLKIRYKKPDEDRSNLLEYPIAASDVRKDLAQTTDDFRFAAAVSYFGNLLRGSQFAGNYTYAEIATLAQNAKGSDQKGYRQEFIEMVKDAAAISRGSGVSEPVARPN